MQIEEIKFSYDPNGDAGGGDVGIMVMSVSFVEHVPIRYGCYCGSHPDVGQKRCFDYLFDLMAGRVLDGNNKPWLVARKPSGATVPDEVAA